MLKMTKTTTTMNFTQTALWRYINFVLLLLLLLLLLLTCSLKKKRHRPLKLASGRNFRLTQHQQEHDDHWKFDDQHDGHDHHEHQRGAIVVGCHGNRTLSPQQLLAPGVRRSDGADQQRVDDDENHARQQRYEYDSKPVVRDVVDVDMALERRSTFQHAPGAVVHRQMPAKHHHHHHHHR